jgi:type I restriction enzyme, R subunit
MPTTDTSEKGLESLIFNSLTGYGSGAAIGAEGVRETGSVRYVAGDPKDYDRDHAVDIDKLLAFLETTQPKVFAQLGIAADGPARLKFLARLQGEIAKRGVVDVLRKGYNTAPLRSISSTARRLRAIQKLRNVLQPTSSASHDNCATVGMRASFPSTLPFS